MTSRIVIIGSGLAGMNLIKEIRKKDQVCSITLFTAESADFYSKPMLSNALAKDKTPDQLAMQKAEAFAQQFNVQLFAHTTVKSFDASNQTLEAGGQTHQWDSLVLALGAKPVMLEAVDVQVQAPYYTVNQLSEYACFRQALDHAAAQREGAPVRVGIIGSGLIGCEFANDLIGQGFSVDVLDVVDRPMARLVAPEQSNALADALSKLGVKWHWEQQVSAIKSQSAGGCAISTKQGLELSVDVVLSAIGLRPQVELAQSAGLEVGPGIQVDRFLRASTPNVYALGDCATVDGVSLQYVLPLMACVRALAQTICGQPTAVNYPAMPVVVKTPACPLVVALPPGVDASQCDWQVSGQSPNYQALVMDATGQLSGFALSGQSVSEKNTLAKKLPAWLAPLGN